MAPTIQSGLIWLDLGQKLNCKASTLAYVTGNKAQVYDNVRVYHMNVHVNKCMPIYPPQGEKHKVSDTTVAPYGHFVLTLGQE